MEIIVFQNIYSFQLGKPDLHMVLWVSQMKRLNIFLSLEGTLDSLNC